jgi:hypothetical protein
VGLTIGMKAGRASLLLGAASVLASSDSVLSDTDIDIKVLKDIKTFVGDIKRKKLDLIANNAATKKSEAGSKSEIDFSIEQTARIKATYVNSANRNEAYHLLKESILR